MSSERIETRLGEVVVVETLATPRNADAIFLSIDASGTTGELERNVLGELGLDSPLPGADRLKRGYFIAQAGGTLLCYVVTDAPRKSSAQLLKANIATCLGDSRLRSCHRLWIPLMGTGTGKLSLVESFRITHHALIATNWSERPKVTITISTPGPEEKGFDMLAQEVATLAPQSLLPEAVSPVSLRGLKPSPAAQAVLSVARALSQLRGRLGLTTEVLLFALADAAQTDAFAGIDRDHAAGAFCSAIHELAGERYELGWKKLIGQDWHVLTNIKDDRLFARATPKAKAILERAAKRAKQSKRKHFTVDDLVQALLASEGVFVEYLKDMEVRRDDLLAAYQDILTGQILMNLHNDAASIDDKLNYAAYANAIASFLCNPKTPAPLSVSVQAPWGAGKSSLMQMIRERLDPEDVRTTHKPKIGEEALGELKLGEVLKFLEQKGKIGPAFWDKEPVAESREDDPPPSDRRELITIWFNAWKYESSEQVWAGLVDAIVSQIGDRLPIIQREAFFLRLHLARIDDGIVRRKIYDRVLALWWTRVQRWLLAGVAAIVTLFGFGQATTEFSELSPLVAYLGTGTAIGQVLLVAYLLRAYFTARANTDAEPAKFSLAPYLTVPDYVRSVGAIHQIHADLRRVLAAAPKEGSGGFAPIVIFIDDLDRCSPGNIASVVEGVSMLLASDTYRCMFVIGMDPQVIAAALEKAHEDIRKRLPSYERGVPLGWRFMDKFVQLPFTIPPQVDLSRYLESLGTLAPVTSDANPTVGGEQSGKPSTETTIRTSDDPKTYRDSVKPEDMRYESTVRSQDDSKDVGRIIRVLSQYSAGNPREIKRMINLARFYLALRNERRRLDPFWRTASVDQYARWIALTLRWPDMMRWLQWGADEAIWPAEVAAANLVARRLRKLEHAACEVDSVEEWTKRIVRDLHLAKDDPAEWRKDPKLFEFFRECGQLPSGRTLSAAAEIGLW